MNVNEVKVGQKVEALAYGQKVWRPAYVVSLTPENTRVGPGCYIQWLDVNPSNLSQSQGGWQPLHCVRPVSGDQKVS